MKGHSKELSSPPGMESSTIVFVRLSKRTTCIAGHLTKSLTRKHIIYKLTKISSVAQQCFQSIHRFKHRISPQSHTSLLHSSTMTTMTTATTKISFLQVRDYILCI